MRAIFLFAALTALVPQAARAGDRIEVIVTESTEIDGNETAVVPGTAAPPGSSPTTHTVEVVEHAPPTRVETTWFGLSLGAVTSPLSRSAAVPTTRKLDANRMHTCFGSGERRACSMLRGADVRLQFYGTRDRKLYPRVIGYLRTGYELGQVDREPVLSADFERGQVTAMSYTAVPVYFGLSVYAFKEFPVRPFVGLGLGADILRLRYTRHEEASRRDITARFGFEIHGGLEVRLTNYVALTAEVKQQWGARRKHDDLPSFANSGLTVMTGLAVSLPQPTWQRSDPPRRVTTVTRKTVPLQPPARQGR